MGWHEDVRGAKRGAFSALERQETRISNERTKRQELFREQLKIYSGYVAGAIAIAIPVAKFFLDYGK